MYEQRVTKETDQFEPTGPWLPAGLPSLPDRLERAQWGPWYVVVDEMHGQGCRFTVDLWPEIDADGRLVFETEQTTTQWVDEEIVRDVVREARQASAGSAESREIADRPLRIGDVFAIWLSAAARLGLALPSRDDGVPTSGVDSEALATQEPAAGLVDVTGEARVAARAAVDAVGAGELTDADLRRLGIPMSAVQETPDSMSSR